MKNRLSTSATIVGPLLAIAVIGAMAWFIWHTVQSAATSQHQPASQGAALSTLTGTVSEGPTKPVCTVGQSCDAVVASHTIQVLDASGNVVATTRTNASGSFTVSLAAGQYALKLVPGIGASDRGYPVTVGPGTTHFDFTADTGIR